MSDLIRRHAQARLDLFAQSFRVVVVEGPRQAGKSTLLRLFQGAHGGSLRTLDDETTLSTALADPRGFVEFGDKPRIVDEIQRGGDALVRAIKYVVDQDNQRGQYVLSGSTRFLTVPTLSESLAGRAVFVELWPFSVAERVGASADFGDMLFGQLDGIVTAGPSTWTRADYLDVVTTGGYPEVVSLPPGAARRGWFEAYLQTVIERDVRGFADIQHAAVVPRMLGLLAARSGSAMVTADVARSVELNHATARRYLTYLETVFLTAACHPYSANLTSRLSKTPKVYVTDSGLAAFLAGTDATTLQRPGHPTLGGLVETFVFGELKRILAAQNEYGTSVMYLRDRDGREVDFVAETRDGRLAGIEVKAAQTVTSSDFRHLSWLRDRLGDRFVVGFVLYLGAETLPFGDRLYAVPLSALWQHAVLPR